MYLGFKEELKELLGEGYYGKGGLPKVFIEKKYIGGVEEIQNFIMTRSLRNCLIVVKGLTTLKEVMVDVRLVVI